MSAELAAPENTENIMTTVALVRGEPVTLMPKDLYIPPEALEVFLETFQGPLDLLLYLIKKQNLNILEIPIAEVTRQYMQYVDLMKNLQLELAAEYLVMAALLAEIKSRLLLPRPVDPETEEEDPRAELIRRLQEYEQIKLAAEKLDELPQVGRDILTATVPVTDSEIPRAQPSVNFRDLLLAFSDVMRRAAHHTKHAIARENLSIRERMSDILSRLKSDEYTDFYKLFTVQEGRAGVVVSFIAILELLKRTLIELTQSEPFAPVYVKIYSSAVVE